jgi:hypothetical protein
MCTLESDTALPSTCTLNSLRLVWTGGDLCAAIARDSAGQLRWYNRGHRIALDIARGLYFLHSHEVRMLCRQRPPHPLTTVPCAACFDGRVPGMHVGQLADRGST